MSGGLSCSQRLSSAGESARLLRHPARSGLPLSLLEMHSQSKSPLCLHHLLTTPSSFTRTEMCLLQLSGRGDPCSRGQGVNQHDRWCFCLSAHLSACLSACSDHRRPACCTRLNRAKEIASRGLLITEVD